MSDGTLGARSQGVVTWLSDLWDAERIGWVVLTILGTAGLAIAAVAIQPVLVLLPVVLLIGYLAIGRPKFALAAWLVVVCVVPHWLSVRFQATLPPASLIAFLLVPALLACGHVRWRAGDLVPLGILGLFTAAFFLFHSPRPYFFAAIVQGLVPYLLARKLVPNVGAVWFARLMATVLTLLAAWAVVEYVTDWHPFVGLYPGSSEANWSAIQERGGHARSEAAFGHAISLGAALAMGAPFVIASSWRGRTKVAATMLLAVGILCTGSRGPAIALAVGLALMLAFYRGRTFGRRQRWVLTVLGIAGGLVMVSALSSRLAASSTEAGQSADYREQLYSFVLRDVHPLAVADHLTILSTGGFEWRQVFHSIDSTFVWTSLIFGWLPVALFAVGAVALLIKTVGARANAAEIALLAQLPVLATVALITQYYALIWFLAGAAVSLGAISRTQAQNAPPPPARLEVDPDPVLV
jgi:hypothetical protein